MKILIRILIILFLIGGIFFYIDTSKESTEPLVGPKSQTQAIPNTVIDEKVGTNIPRPENGISTYVGKTKEKLLKDFGAPIRMEPSRYNYDWWIYNQDNEFIMFGVDGEKVNQVYTNALEADVHPYTIGQSMDDIYRMTIVESEIVVNIEETIYLFMMNEQDLSSRLLVEFDGVYAQLYIDRSTNSLVGIRYLDGETLVKHQAYEYQYIGELIPFAMPSSYEQETIDTAYENQIYDVVNTFRKLNNLESLVQSPILNEVANAYSKDVFLSELEVNSAEEVLSIDERLETNELELKKVSVNTAVNYYDAIEVVHGWLNSEEHRKIMFKDSSNVTGIGVYLNQYTQIIGERKMLINR